MLGAVEALAKLLKRPPPSIGGRVHSVVLACILAMVVMGLSVSDEFMLAVSSVSLVLVSWCITFSLEKLFGKITKDKKGR